jgi:hypothetical protein
VGQGVLDLDSLTQLGPAVGGLLRSAQLHQQPLVGVDLHAAAPGAGGALGAQRTRLAGLGVSLPPGQTVLLLLAAANRDPTCDGARLKDGAAGELGWRIVAREFFDAARDQAGLLLEGRHLGGVS